MRAGAHRGTLAGSGGLFRDFVSLLDYPDPRRIDLRVSVRDPFEAIHVRRFEQNSAISVYVLVDVSASMGFGGGNGKMRWPPTSQPRLPPRRAASATPSA